MAMPALQQCPSPLLRHQQPRRAPEQTEEMMACVTALDTYLLPCLPARELQAIDRSSHPSHPTDVEKHARDFMEAVKKLQLYFIGLQHLDHQPSQAETLRKEIAVLAAELKMKNEVVRKQEGLIQGWKRGLEGQLGRHKTELERV